MKRRRFFLIAMVISGLAIYSGMFDNYKSSEYAAISPFVISDQESDYKVDPATSTLKWIGKKITYGHHGTLELNNGSLSVSNNKVTGGEFEINMMSIKNKDLTDESRNKRLVGHLKSKDFFNVEEFPASKFKITSIKTQQSDLGNYAVTGDLTIKGITHELNFPANINIEDSKLKATGKMVFDRSKYEVRYGSGSFFEDLGDKMIYDDIEIEVTLIAYSY